VRDERHFDPEVQFLATLGYAVLQVNFRGSEGYGNSYRKAGMGGYGTLIEDDIDRALDAALAKYPLDHNRMCTMGTSYGGYSALMSAVRHPDRFRCVISVSGPTDRTLSFTASDAAYGASGRKALEKYIGDPGAHPDELLRISPIYRAAEIKAPLLLIHGTEDDRVDYENARRLVRMLNIAGRPPSLIRLDGEGHGIRAMKNRVMAFPAIAAFLSEYLKGDAATSSPSVH
jgi:dipeptidyl aminopeptidase/acylaminoacyl peptidase